MALAGAARRRTGTAPCARCDCALGRRKQHARADAWLIGRSGRPDDRHLCRAGRGGIGCARGHAVEAGRGNVRGAIAGLDQAGCLQHARGFSAAFGAARPGARRRRGARAARSRPVVLLCPGRSARRWRQRPAAVCRAPGLRPRASCQHRLPDQPAGPFRSGADRAGAQACRRGEGVLVGCGRRRNAPSARVGRAIHAGRRVAQALVSLWRCAGRGAASGRSPGAAVRRCAVSRAGDGSCHLLAVRRGLPRGRRL